MITFSLILNQSTGKCHTSIEKRMFDAGINFKTLSELDDTLTSITNGGAAIEWQMYQKKLNQQSIINEYIYNPGNATTKIVELILDELYK